MLPIRIPYAVIFDVKAWLDPLDGDRAESRWHYAEEHALEFAGLEFAGVEDVAGIRAAAYAARERRLFDRLRRNPAVLDRWLKDEAVCAVAYNHDIESSADFDDEVVLGPLVRSLEPTHREYFERAFASTYLFEWGDAFYASADATVFAMSLAALPEIGRPSDPCSRRYRVIVKVQATLGPLDERRAEQCWVKACEANSPAATPTAAEFIGHQSRLLAAVSEEPAVVERWLRREVCLTVSDCGAEPLVDREQEEVILAPVIAELSEADRAYYAEAVEREMFYEYACGIVDSGRAKIERIAIAKQIR